MRFEINKVVKEMDLGDRNIAILMPKSRWDRFKERRFPNWLLEKFPAQYERKAEALHVWVNPPRSLRFKLSRGIALANKDKAQDAAEDIFSALSELWGQHDLKLSKEDVQQLAFYLIDQDPGAWEQMVGKTLEMIAAEIDRQEKK